MQRPLTHNNRLPTAEISKYRPTYVYVHVANGCQVLHDVRPTSAFFSFKIYFFRPFAKRANVCLNLFIYFVISVITLIMYLLSAETKRQTGKRKSPYPHCLCHVKCVVIKRDVPVLPHKMLSAKCCQWWVSQGNAQEVSLFATLWSGWFWIKVKGTDAVKHSFIFFS